MCPVLPLWEGRRHRSAEMKAPLCLRKLALLPRGDHVGRLLGCRPMGYGRLARLVVLVLSSCSTEQGVRRARRTPRSR